MLESADHYHLAILVFTFRHLVLGHAPSLSAAWRNNIYMAVHENRWLYRLLNRLDEINDEQSMCPSQIYSRDEMWMIICTDMIGLTK